MADIPPHATTTYRADIQGLRAVAVVAVIAFHFFAASLPGGFLGVDVFFVISGFLITQIVQADVAAGRWSFSNFMMRRLRRLVPALLVVLFAASFAAWFLLPPYDMREFGKNLVSSALFVSNWLLARQTDYFAAPASQMPLVHTWSLAIEAQLYLVLGPVLVWIIARPSRHHLPVVASLAACCFLVGIVLHVCMPDAAYFLPPLRAFAFLCGALTALTGLRMDRTQIIPVLALVIVFVAFLLGQETIAMPIRAMLTIAGSCLLLHTATPETVAHRLLSLQPLQKLGAISYSLYLWHQPVYAYGKAFSHYLGAPGAAALALMLFATLVLSMLSYRFVEVPFRSAQNVSPKLFAGLAIVALLALLPWGTVAYVSDGFRALRTSPNQISLLNNLTHSPLRAQCHTKGAEFLPPAQACNMSTNPPRWAVMGDSHAIELAYALGQLQQQKREGVLQLSFSNCPPHFALASSQTDHCARWSEEAIRMLDQNGSVRAVVLAYRLNYYLSGPMADVYPDIPDSVSPAHRAAIWNNLIALASHFKQQGKAVFVVLQVPELRRRLDSLVFLHGDRDDDIIGMDRGWWRARNAFAAERLEDLRAVATVIDPQDLFCDDRNCFAVKDGVPLYFDDNHVTVQGAAEIAAAIAR